MFNKYSVIPLAVATVIASGAPSFAQNIPAWENNEAQKINQAVGMGMVNPSQAQGLTTREMQIQQETQQYAMRNGGYLTPSQQNRVAGDLKELDRRLNNDIKRDHNGNYGSYGNYGYGNGLVGMGTAMPIATMPIAPMIPSTGLLGYNGYNNGYSGYNNGYNSGGFLSGIMNSGIGSGLLSHHLPGLSGLPMTPVTPTTPAITPTSLMTPFSGITGSNHHHSNGLFHS